MKTRVILMLLAVSLTFCGKDNKESSDKRTSRTDQPDPGETADRDESKGDKTEGKDDTQSTDQEFDLSQSKFCPAVKPELPEDPTPPLHFDLEFINEKLASDEGLNGWMHGVVQQYRHFVFTYRSEDRNDPMSFFKAEQFSLIAANADVENAFANLNRHDKVKLTGRMLDSASPVRHIIVTHLEITKPYDKAKTNVYEHNPDFVNGAEIFNLVGKVHAKVFLEGKGYGIVVDYKDYLVPVIVNEKHNEVAAKLYRNDIVNVQVRYVKHGNRPPHLETIADNENAIDVIDYMSHCHSVETVLEGFLVKFDKSPSINRDIYAVRVVDANGIGRNFTFFPSADPGSDPEQFMKVFLEISEMAKAQWDAKSDQAKIVRNYSKNEQIRIKVKGRMNVVSTEQANPQIYIDDAQDAVFSISEQ